MNQHLFNSLSRASSTSKASERVPCQAKMFLNSLKADLNIILELYLKLQVIQESTQFSRFTLKA